VVGGFGMSLIGDKLQLIKEGYIYENESSLVKLLTETTTHMDSVSKIQMSIDFTKKSIQGIKDRLDDEKEKPQGDTTLEYRELEKKLRREEDWLRRLQGVVTDPD
jgi:hypothetical protein